MKKGYCFKRVSAEDAPALCDLYYQLTKEHPDEELTRSLLQTIADDRNYYIFGEYDEGALVGTVTLSRCIDLTGDGRFYFSLENFVVDEKQRRKGVGKFLLEEAESFARSENARYFCFTSSAARTDALVYRERLNFEVVFDTVTFPDTLFAELFQPAMSSDYKKTFMTKMRSRTPDFWEGVEYLYRTYEVKRKYNRWKSFGQKPAERKEARRNLAAVKKAWKAIYKRMPA